MPAKNINSKLLAVSGGAVLTSLVGIFGFYIPFYSSAAIENRRRREVTPGNATADANKISASVWKNIDRAAKQARENKSKQK